MRRRDMNVVRLSALLLFLFPCTTYGGSFVFTGSLAGSNENPPTASPATGSATVTYDDAAHSLRVQVTFSGLGSGTTAAHIHCCIAPPMNTGVATPSPSFPGFPLGVTSGTYDGMLDLTNSSSFNPAFVTAHGGTVAAAESALVTGLAQGMAYLNIHTSVFPGGEIRSFLVCADMSTAPSVTPPAAGTTTQTHCQ